MADVNSKKSQAFSASEQLYVAAGLTMILQLGWILNGDFTQRFPELFNRQTAIAAVLGCVFILVTRFWVMPYRCLGFVPPAVLGLNLGVLLHWPMLLVFSFVVMLHVPLYLVMPHPWHWRVSRGVKSVQDWRTGWIRSIGSVLVVLIAIHMIAGGAPEFATMIFWIIGVLLLLFSILAFYRSTVELCFEFPTRLLYSVRGDAETLRSIPTFGPVIVVANHAAWMDPLFVAKICPRPFKPIMTAKFFQMWFLKPLLKYVFRVIVVPEKPIRREAPELQIAMASVRSGECLLIFPEGYLRRKEEQPIRRFGRGIWQILQELPETQVVFCWIEGNWGSYFSYAGGPPTKNKKIPFRQRIRMSTTGPELVPSEMLADQHQCRNYLMHRLLAARARLGLPDLPPAQIPEFIRDVGDEA